MSGKKPTIDEIISKTIQATRLDCAQQPNDVFKATEKRLYAYPVIKAKIESDRNMLKSYLAGDKPTKCSAFVRFQKSGVRLSDEEILEMLTRDTRAKIAANEFEIETIDKAMEIIAADQYAKVIPCLYFDGKTVAETGEAVPCDRSTVFRQKARLVQRLATFLYGVSAL
ncbi:hypothetical protein FACS1894187_06920 [Synergistales bacterium]|nr:hypothetical protein FACS1894187_06920 [Synergistales bacterium]